MRVRVFALAVVAAALGALILAPAALGHAVLKGTEPVSGQILKRDPGPITFRFSEPVEGKFGAIRIYDRQGRRVDSGESFHPGGRGPELATRLERGLPDGTYTATYRILSADSHPVSGGLVFSLGEPSAAGLTVSELLDQRGGTGSVTKIAFGAARAIQYGAIALAIGAVFFLLATWLPSLRRVAGGGGEWQAASEAFIRRLRLALSVAVCAGILSGAAGIVLQGATGAGVSFWSALEPEIVRDVLDTRFGMVWGLRMLVWVALGAMLLPALSGSRRPVLRPASVGATGLALARSTPGRVGGVLVLAGLAFLAISPALSGHAGLEDPTAVLMPANAVHVVAISVWTGGLALLLFALPAATRRLARPDRARLLASNLARFSTIAGIAYLLLVASGVTQSLIEVRALDNLDNFVDTPFGRAVLIKICIVLGPLLLLGAYNRRKLVPALNRIAAGGQSPGRAGLLLRRSLQVELLLVVAALGVTGALVSYPPSTAVSAAGPVAERVSMGPLDLQLTVDPAKVGANQVHIYLTRKSDGSQFNGTREFTLDFTLPAKRLSLDADVRKAGPGHYTVPGAVFGVAGDWQMNASARVSEFDAYYAKLEIPIR